MEFLSLDFVSHSNSHLCKTRFEYAKKLQHLIPQYCKYWNLINHVGILILSYIIGVNASFTYDIEWKWLNRLYNWSKWVENLCHSCWTFWPPPPPKLISWVNGPSPHIYYLLLTIVYPYTQNCYMRMSFLTCEVTSVNSEYFFSILLFSV